VSRSFGLYLPSSIELPTTVTELMAIATAANIGNHPNIPTRNYEPFDIEINQEFIDENKKINLNLVRHGQNRKHKFAPFTKSQRRKRRMEVYKLHFEHGVPAIRIAEMMKVDRNTINNDLQIKAVYYHDIKQFIKDALETYKQKNDWVQKSLRLQYIVEEVNAYKHFHDKMNEKLTNFQINKIAGKSVVLIGETLDSFNKLYEDLFK
jgi:hypothetical protein